VMKFGCLVIARAAEFRKVEDDLFELQVDYVEESYNSQF